MRGMKLGFIGAGNMATAILDGVVSKDLAWPEGIYISNPHPEKLEYPKSLGVHTTQDNAQVAAAADLIILAVKPQKFEEVLPGIAEHVAGKCVVSIAAGISTDYLKSRLPGAHVVRVMPNTPLQLGMGATAIAQAPDVPEFYFRAVCDIFAAAGLTAVIPESQMDAVIPVSGSSPAFFFRMAAAMTRWAGEQGMDEDLALQLCAATMAGAAEMLLSSGKSAQALTNQVCSPGGTTLAALTAFDERDFEGLISDAMTRCAQRSKELGK